MNRIWSSLLNDDRERGCEAILRSKLHELFGMAHFLIFKRDVEVLTNRGFVLASHANTIFIHFVNSVF